MRFDTADQGVRQTARLEGSLSASRVGSRPTIIQSGQQRYLLPGGSPRPPTPPAPGGPDEMGSAARDATTRSAASLRLQGPSAHRLSCRPGSDVAPPALTSSRSRAKVTSSPWSGRQTSRRDAQGRRREVRVESAMFPPEWLGPIVRLLRSEGRPDGGHPEGLGPARRRTSPRGPGGPASRPATAAWPPAGRRSESGRWPWSVPAGLAVDSGCLASGPGQVLVPVVAAAGDPRRLGGPCAARCRVPRPARPGPRRS